MTAKSKKGFKQIEKSVDSETKKQPKSDLLINQWSEKASDYTVGDYIQDTLDDWLDSIISSGELFTIDIFELVRIMDDKNKGRLFEKINSLSIPELVFDYSLDGPTVVSWINRYIYYNQLWRLSNKQFVSKASTNEQMALYYYLAKLKLINLDGIPDAKYQAVLLSFLLNRDTENVRSAMRNISIKENQKKFLSKPALKRLIKLAEEIKNEELKGLVEADLRRLYKN